MSFAVVLGDTVKALEKSMEVYLKQDEPFIVRLDGAQFSKFTKGFKKPFDLLFVDAMVLTTQDLLNRFHPSTAYCHSDEITLVFPAACSKEELEAKQQNLTEHPHGGRVSKILSCFAGYCSVRWNYNLQKLIMEQKDQYDEKTIEKVCAMQCYFDARIVECPASNPTIVVDHMVWRSILDSRRNAVSTYCRHVCKGTNLHKKGSREMIQMMKDAGLDWEENVPLFMKHGVYLKKEMIQKECENPHTGETVMATRSCVKCCSFKIQQDDEHWLKLMVAKHWPSEFGLREGILKRKLKKKSKAERRAARRNSKKQKITSEGDGKAIGDADDGSNEFDLSQDQEYLDGMEMVDWWNAQEPVYEFRVGQMELGTASGLKI